MVLRLALTLQVRHHGGDLVVGDVGALDADGLGVLRLGQEHVPHADEVLGARGVEDDAGVDARGHGKPDAAGDVRLDEARDYVGGGALGGDDEVDAGRAGELGDAADGELDLLAHVHHEVGQLVDDDDEVGQLGAHLAGGRLLAGLDGPLLGGDLGLHLLLAETWLEQGDNEQALKILKEYRKQRPDSELVQQELGILYVKTGHFKDADKVFSALPQRLRTSFVRYAHAQALVGLKQPHRAIQQLRLAVQESPEFVDAWFELARLLEADRQFSEANEIYNSLIEQDPDNPDIWIRMVEGQIRAGKGQKALDYALNGPATYGYKLTAATLFLDARMYPEAEALLDGLKSDPNAPDEVHFYLAAIAYEYHKDVQETLNFLESIPPENRFYDRALRLRIQLLHDQQRYEDAMQLILQGQSQFPTERDFRLMEIHLYLLQDRYKEALTAATAAQQIWPSDDEIAYVYGSVLDSLGRKREALAVMESIVARNPEDYQALNYVGYSLAEQGKDLDRAVLLLEAALKQAPDHAYILDSLAWAHFRRGENAEAWELVRRATSLPDGGDPTIWEHYGDIANAQGLKNEARTGWERALELDHPNPETIRKKLNSL